MSRGVYIAWVTVLSIGLAIAALTATLGTALRLDPAQEARCAAVADGSHGPLIGHVLLRDCVVDATDARPIHTPEGMGAIVALRSPEIDGGPPVAWMVSRAPAHRRWAAQRSSMDAQAQDRYLARHEATLRPRASIDGWARKRSFALPDAVSVGADRPMLSLDRPLEPLAVGGSLAAALLLVLLITLVAHRRRWREAQLRWAHGEGLRTSEGDAPRPF